MSEETDVRHTPDTPADVPAGEESIGAAPAPAAPDEEAPAAFAGGKEAVVSASQDTPENERNDEKTVETPAGFGPDTDYEALAKADVLELKRLFPACRDLSHIGEIDRPLRYAELRDLGLSVEEAFLATNHRRLAPAPDTRRHIRSAVPRAADGGGSMNAGERRAARELFSDLSDRELDDLFRRATEQKR